MNIIDFLSSVSKLAIVAFFITLAAIIVELFLLSKQTQKNKKIEIPEFDPGINATPINVTQIIEPKHKQYIFKGNNKQVKILVILFAILLISAIFVVGNNLIKNTDLASRFLPGNQENEKEMTANIIESKGIEVFDRNWEIIPANQYSNLEPGEVIYIGIYTIESANITKARIRINQNQWQDEHETTDFNIDWQVYYRQYLIGAYDDILKIEAELRSNDQGWLTK